MRRSSAFVLRHRLGILVIVVALAVDQVSKLAMVRSLEIGESWPTQGIWHFTRASNTGGALDLFSGHTVLLLTVSIVGLGLLFALYWNRPKTEIRPQLAFGFLLAGAAGNMIDRFVFGHVIDFIDVVPWLVFNVADVSILIGILGFIHDIPELVHRLTGGSAPTPL